MRELQKYSGQRKPRKKAEPIAEGIRKTRRPNGFFSKMSDDELVEYAQSVIREKGVKSRDELKKIVSGLYETLRKRNLKDRIGLVNPQENNRDWASMSDEDIVEYAKRILRDKGLKTRTELQKADSGLYKILRKRGLRDKIRFETIRKRARDWASMSDDELVRYAIGFLDEKNVEKRKDLFKVDQGLYSVLKTRELLDRVFPETSGRRPRCFFSEMSHIDLVIYARRIVREKGVKKRSGLIEADSGLYTTLRKRNLLDRVFAPIESQRKLEAVQQVVDAMKEFGA